MPPIRGFPSVCVSRAVGLPYEVMSTGKSSHQGGEDESAEKRADEDEDQGGHVIK